jgi:hypothetical protein
MRFNTIPFLFLPAALLFGYLVNEWSGVVWALAVWSGPVLFGTALTVRRHLADAARGRRDARQGRIAAPRKRSA